MRKHDVQGLSIALVDDQRVVWAQGFGFADVAKAIPAGPETVYHVGSISKLFTATSAMQLAEQGRLDIDRPVQAYLPGFSIKRRDSAQQPITVRQLMTHHAGLPASVLKGMWTPRPEPFARVVDQLEDEYLICPPDTVFSYSNVGMTLLGGIVQEISGRDFASYLQASLLQPLAMANAYFAPTILDGERHSKGFGVVVLANSASARPVVDRVAVEALKLALEAKTGIVQPASGQRVAREHAQTADTLHAFEGHYTTLVGAVAVERHGGRLRAEAVDRTFDLVPRGDGWFGLQCRLFGLIPVTLSELDPYTVRRSSLSGREILIASDGHQRMLAGERLTPSAVPEAWRLRTGRYEIMNRGQDEPVFGEPSLIIKDGLLLLRAKAPDDGEAGEIAVEPLSDTEAILLGALTGAGETIQATQIDGVEMLRYSGYLFRRKAD